VWKLNVNAELSHVLKFILEILQLFGAVHAVVSFKCLVQYMEQYPSTVWCSTHSSILQLFGEVHAGVSFNCLLQYMEQ